MHYFLGLIATLILLFISIIHFYWAFGGIWGLKQAVPTLKNTEHLFKPSPIATALVGIVMLGFALLYAEKSGVFIVKLPDFINTYGLKAVATVFLIRAIGDFNYVGLTKKIKDTVFAKSDTKLYVPLCLFLSFAGFYIDFVS